MELFDKKYVHFMWDDELAGKKGFTADTIRHLIELVNNHQYITTVSHYSSDTDYGPFYDGGNVWRFFYYDPNYEIKWAHNEGKMIQFLSRQQQPNGKWPDGKLIDVWCDCVGPDEPKFLDNVIYRVKPEEPKPRHMTYRELCEWLAKGNGEVTWSSTATNCSVIEYYSDEEDDEVRSDYGIRRWNSDEWIEPTVDIYNADCRKEEV